MYVVELGSAPGLRILDYHGEQRIRLRPVHRHSSTQGESVSEPHYTIIKGEDREELINEVNALVKKGYIPAGGVCVVQRSADEPYGVIFFQAMWDSGVFTNMEKPDESRTVPGTAW